MPTSVKIENDKYEFVVDLGIINILRWGAEWVSDLQGPGSKAIMGLVFELDEASNHIKTLESRLKAADAVIKLSRECIGDEESYYQALAAYDVANQKNPEVDP